MSEDGSLLRQDVLGEHQDASTQASWLREQAPAAALAPSTLVATGAVVHALERRAARLRRRFPRAWKRFDRRRIRRMIAQGLAGRPPQPPAAEVTVP